VVSRRRGPRRLSAEEAELWQKVVEHAAPMHPRRKTGDEPKPVLTPPLPSAPDPIAPFAIKGRPSDTRITVNTAPTVSKGLAQQPLAMDAKAFTRMRRGKLPVEGRIDLHGMTLDQAHPALIEYILTANAMGKRLVLVITGKGTTKRNHDVFAHQGQGVLKRQVPLWLRMAPLSGAVLQVSEAHQSHGGSGAYYVYLRRAR
jgi:DNA-nicking Smr family endonuclease